ncbi:tRNA methylation protein [Martiniozyma asiatica (nom. inval.)]|nr:tRNA methylation protein [Martiniozyma asiatica]
MVKNTLRTDVQFDWRSLYGKSDTLERDDIQKLLTFLVKTKSLAFEDQLGLLDSIFPSIYASVIKSGGLGDYKVLACDTLVVWLSRSVQIIKQTKGSVFLYTDVQQKLHSHLDSAKADYLFHYVLDFWNDSGSALGNSLKELFVKLIAFVNATLDPLESQQIFKTWLMTSLSLSYDLRVFYFMVEHLHKEVPVGFVLSHNPRFVENCLQNISSNALASNVGKTVLLVLRHSRALFNDLSETEKEIKWVDMWKNAVVQALENSTLKKGVESYLLPHLFKINREATILFLKYVTQDPKQNIGVLFSSLKLAQESAVLIEPFLSTEDEEAIIDISVIEKLLVSKDGSYRLSALGLLVNSPKLSKQIPSIVYQKILSSLDVIFTDTDLELRDEMFSLLKKFTHRIRDSTYALDRDAKSLAKKDCNRFKMEIEGKIEAIEESKKYFNSLVNHVISNIQPGSAYQKKEMGYRILIMLVQSGLDERVNKKYFEKVKTVEYCFTVPIYDSLLIRLAIDNISDNFEDVRTATTKILMMSPLNIDETIDIQETEERALLLLSSMKGQSIDSGARFYQFLYAYYQGCGKIAQCQKIIEILIEKIDYCILMAQRDISTACYKYGIQGFFAAFKFIFEIINWTSDLGTVVNKLIDLAKKVWSLTKFVLQHDSPEGHLPKELENYSEDLEEKYGKGTQVILSYAWRSMKESSMMIEVIFRCGSKSLSKETALDLGPLLIEQLATIRHRGAFSSVYPTFVACCSFCVKNGLDSKPKEWLDENLSLIQTRSKYITRRSAGVPYLITAILTSSKKLMDETFEKLMDVALIPIDDATISDAATENVNLPQVNAFNCIKVLFIDSQLSDESVFYVDRALSLSLNAMGSPIWSLRNCAVMLFTALQNRLFNSKKVKNDQLPSYPARIFFNKFKTVRNVFYETLKNVNSKSDLEMIFPILTIMSRLEPTPEYTGLDDFKPLIREFLGSKIWKVREMAARSFPSVISSREEFKACFESFSDIEWGQDWNFIHGGLLAQKELLNRVNIDAYKSEDGDLLDDKTINMVIFARASSILDFKTPWAIKLAFFNVLKLLPLDLSELNILSEFFYANCELKDGESLDGAKQLAIKVLAEILFENIKDQQFSKLLNRCMFSNMYELQLTAFEFAEQNFQKLETKICLNLMADIWEFVLLPNIWSYVKSSAFNLLKVLAVATKDQKLNSDEVSKGVVELSNLSQEDSNEVIRLTTLEALGTYIARLLIINPGEIKYFVDWVQRIKAMANDFQEIHIRLAALRSIVGFNSIYFPATKNSTTEMTNKINCVIHGLIFRYLSDDDTDLTLLAGESLSLVLSENVDILPVEVEKLFMKNLADTVISKPYLRDIIFSIKGDQWYEGVFEWFGTTKLMILMKEDSQLFGSEKSNLDRDMTIKAKELALLISQLNQNYSDLEPLQPLIAQCQSNLEDMKALNEKDGPLGLLSDDGLFQFYFSTIIIANKLKTLGVAMDSYLKEDWHELLRQI